jgi:hypothetical protein
MVPRLIGRFASEYGFIYIYDFDIDGKYVARTGLRSEFLD